MCRQPATRSIVEKPIKRLIKVPVLQTKKHGKQESLKERVGRPAHRKDWACERVL